MTTQWIQKGKRKYPVVFNSVHSMILSTGIFDGIYERINRLQKWSGLAITTGTLLSALASLWFSVSVFRCTLHLPGHPSGLGSVSSSSCAHSTAPLFRFQTQSIFCTCFLLLHVPHARFSLTVIHPGTAKCNWHTSWHLAVGHGRTTASRSMLKIFGMRVRWFQRTTYTPDNCIPRVTACEIIRCLQ